ncbi:MAG: hypothetical protein WC665_10605 [Sulfurimonas sp.]|jgi:purine-nucleoside phosphorylase
MLYIITALKPEAQAFIDRYRLQKSKLGDFNIFTNKETTLIVSGLGIKNATLATQTLIDHFDITDDDMYINVGICGASKEYKIGELLQIGAINYKNQTYTANQKIQTTIECLDEEAKDKKYEIVDMESFGFYDAVIHSPAIKNYSIFKVVSDHFEPHKVTKDGTKSLIFNVIDAINNIIFTKAKS